LTAGERIHPVEGLAQGRRIPLQGGSSVSLAVEKGLFASYRQKLRPSRMPEYASALTFSCALQPNPFSQFDSARLLNSQEIRRFSAAR
jgi:hypothetical protein